jgi:hypothetical protein
VGDSESPVPEAAPSRPDVEVVFREVMATEHDKPKE